MGKLTTAKIAKLALEHPLVIFLQEIGKAGNSRFCVIAAGVTLEILINKLLEHHCKKHGKRFAECDFEKRLLILHEIGILSDDSFRQLNHFRKLRNDAAHKKFEINERTLSQLPVTIKTSDEHMIVNNVCLNIVKNLHDEHEKVLARHFWKE